MNIETYLDRHNLVKPHNTWGDASGEGVIITVIATLVKVFGPDKAFNAVTSCIDIRTGCLMRRPTNENGFQSHDGWMSLAVLLLYVDNRVLARGLLVSAITRGFYMKHRPFEFEGKTLWQKLDEIMKPALFRFPKIWITLFAAAWPNRVVKFLCFLLIRIQTSVTSPPLSDASACQLIWLNCRAMQLMNHPSPMYSFLKALKKKNTSITEVMARDFFDADHPIIEGYRAYEAEMLP